MIVKPSSAIASPMRSGVFAPRNQSKRTGAHLGAGAADLECRLVDAQELGGLRRRVADGVPRANTEVGAHGAHRSERGPLEVIARDDHHARLVEIDPRAHQELFGPPLIARALGDDA